MLCQALTVSGLSEKAEKAIIEASNKNKKYRKETDYEA